MPGKNISAETPFPPTVGWLPEKFMLKIMISIGGRSRLRYAKPLRVR